ncbi:hypothetical protein BJX96DRAFT_69523 [Aspergillus floccosus]
MCTLECDHPTLKLLTFTTTRWMTFCVSPPINTLWLSVLTADHQPPAWTPLTRTNELAGHGSHGRSWPGPTSRCGHRGPALPPGLPRMTGVGGPVGLGSPILVSISRFFLSLSLVGIYGRVTYAHAVETPKCFPCFACAWDPEPVVSLLPPGM